MICDDLSVKGTMSALESGETGACVGVAGARRSRTAPVKSAPPHDKTGRQNPRLRLEGLTTGVVRLEGDSGGEDGDAFMYIQLMRSYIITVVGRKGKV